MSVTPPQLGRPIGADGEQTRARIIDAAMRCVAEMGYSRTTIREIARAADMTSGSLYHYFPNKSELLDAAVEDIERIALPRLRAAAARGDDVVVRLTAVLDESSEMMREHPHLAAFDRAVRAESNEHPVRGRPKYPGLKALRDTITEIVGEARALPPGTDPRAVADALHALARGLTERAASLDADAYAATLASAKALISGTLFARPANRPESTARRRSARDP
ncbi:TetR/AcrR family transcriptional regulator [Mycobacterium nebraskense]|uniref:TetR family transcriptional regulator n=2 Tax=Mycobacterium nebraskense TaxID=244292 RepID=A0A1X1ZWH8_9MYCO|nr:TetR/AcrR family transcriptional regulator [Mycobacterium nebraskense]MBI2693718.1 TetR/AcrR family transcriptional regulator [Mycobacterium nebraskense]MCV7118526.1 TetR/AcrR family transcriptional regulator [Mycobacterium nebraskense]ORW28512.1 TetR family transcriptional regulator [Mycobacterium nebraskense]